MAWLTTFYFNIVSVLASLWLRVFMLLAFFVVYLKGNSYKVGHSHFICTTFVRNKILTKANFNLASHSIENSINVKSKNHRNSKSIKMICTI